jgi:hypothetical protein
MSYQFNYNYKQEDLTAINSMITGFAFNEQSKILIISRYDGTHEYVNISDVISDFSEADSTNIKFVKNKPSVKLFNTILDYTSSSNVTNGDIVLIGIGNQSKYYVNNNGTLKQISVSNSDLNGRIILGEYGDSKNFFEDEIVFTDDKKIVHSLGYFKSDNYTKISDNIDYYKRGNLIYQVEEILSYGLEASFKTIQSGLSSGLTINDRFSLLAISDFNLSTFDVYDFYNYSVDLIDPNGNNIGIDVSRLNIPDGSNNYISINPKKLSNPTLFSCDFTFAYYLFANNSLFGIEAVDKSTNNIVYKDIVSIVSTNGNAVRTRVDLSGTTTSNPSNGTITLSIGDLSSNSNEIEYRLYIKCDKLSNINIQY